MLIKYSGLIEEKGIKKLGLSKSEISAAFYKPDQKEEVVSAGSEERGIILFTKKVAGEHGGYILLGIAENQNKCIFIYFALKVPLYVHENADKASPQELLKSFGNYFGTETIIGEVKQKIYINQVVPIGNTGHPNKYISVPNQNLHEYISLEIFADGDNFYDRVLVCLLVVNIDFTIYLPKVASYYSKGYHRIKLTNKETGFVNNHTVHTPTLFRYLPKEYVDQFFKDGSLRISSFKAFKNHKNEQKLDTSEGDFRHIHTTKKDGGKTIVVDWTFGLDAYVLCTTVNYSKDVQKAFECDSYIKINNSVEFASEIATAIADYRLSIEGPCIYQTKKMILEDLGYIDIDEFKNEKGELDEKRFTDSMRRNASRYGFFLKSREYAHQNEYRFGWVIKSEPKEFIAIKVPGAIKFCSRPHPFDE